MFHKQIKTKFKSILLTYFSILTYPDGRAESTTEDNAILRMIERDRNANETHKWMKILRFTGYQA